MPSANWEMKRWPKEHWRKLIALLPDYHFIILGGPNDAFCEEIRAIAPDRSNLAGKTSLLESCFLIHQSHLVVSADTGLMHTADLFRIPTFALMGPTAFGFPTGPTAKILEVALPCRPCTKDGRGKCKQSVFQKCMVDITPEKVAGHIRHLFPL
ncbi:MAG: glycosyltransferase family 9 protein [Odoribacter sp.]